MDTTNALYAAFAIQSATELLDALLCLATPKWSASSNRASLLRLFAFGVAAGAAYWGGINVVGGAWGQLLTALAISGGTEGVNSLLKIAAYSKERTKVLSGKKLPDVVEEGEMSVANFSMLTNVSALRVDRPTHLSIEQCQEVIVSATPHPPDNPRPEITLQSCGVDSPEKTRLFRADVEQTMKTRGFVVDATNMPADGNKTIRDARTWLFSHHGVQNA